MSKEILDEALGDVLSDNYLKENASNSTGVGKWEPLIFPLIKKIYPQSLVDQIASVQPTKSPVAKISYLNSIYTFDDSNVNDNIHWTNSCLITVPVSASGSFTANKTTVYTTTAGVPFTVWYKENSKQYTSTAVTATGPTQGNVLTRSFPDAYTHMLVRTENFTILNGAVGASATRQGNNTVYAPNNALILTGDAVSGIPVLYATTNRNTIKRVFKDYSLTLENNSNLYEVNFETATNIIETKSRKIRTKFNQETLQDYKALYKEKAYDIVAEAVANEIRQEIDREVIGFLKQIATPMPEDINIQLSISMTNGDVGGLTYDLYCSIYLAAEEIVKATKRNRTMFVLADSATCAFLLLNPLHSDATPTSNDPYKVGKVGAYDLYCDPYSTEHYIIVGYRFNSPEKHDAGLYFTPYMTSIHEVESGNDPFTENFMTLNRYGYCQHPQDCGTGNGDSDFFRFFSVNFFNNTTRISNVSNQIRTNF